MCKVMGIVNVTPDSFSDGGKFNTPEEAIRRAKNLIEEGAAIIDIGGESTRPGATPLKWDEEWARVEPVLRGLSPQFLGSVPISIDTYHPETAERAIALGVSIVNCVYQDPIRDMAAICAKNNAELVIPCRISDFTKGTVLIFAGTVPLDMGRLYLDPMIGFGTTREEDLEILRSISELAKRGRVLVGASRKRIVKRLVGEKARGKDLAGNLAIAVWAAISGASVVRVHDVRETVQALKVTAALVGGEVDLEERQ